MKEQIYFDHAATSYPKPKQVISAINNAMIFKGGNPGRSSHKLSFAAASAIFDCREQVCNFFSFEFPERVIFTQNATYALNIALFGLAQNNSHIIISNLEHNSVLRPVYALSKSGRGISYSVFDATSDNEGEIYSSFVKHVKPNTKIAAVTVASNICGKILPIAKIGKYCKEHGILFIVDASQASGVIPINFYDLNIDVLCTAGHKGLYGPTGTGIAIFGQNAEPRPSIYGGNGVNSYDREMSGMLPEILEAGTVNTIGICGLSAGIKYLTGNDILANFEHVSFLTKYLSLALSEMENIELYGDYDVKTPVILFNLKNYSPEEVAKLLDDNGFCIRSGLHCAPLAHKALGTAENGALRVSFGHKNTKRQVDAFIDTIYKMQK